MHFGRTFNWLRVEEIVLHDLVLYDLDSATILDCSTFR
jgi:hypothetical protein